MLETKAEDVNKNEVSTEPSQTSSHFGDIGNIVNATMTTEEINVNIRKLSDADKYDLLKNHVKPIPEFEFPVTEDQGFLRSFQFEWFNTFSWLVYSIVLDGAFCLPCILFSKLIGQKGSFVQKPFTKWRKFSTKGPAHAKKKYHMDAIDQASIFVKAKANPTRTVNVLLNTKKAQSIQRNRSIVKCVIEALLFCSKQCIRIRGHNENINLPGNHGNFIALLS